MLDYWTKIKSSHSLEACIKTSPVSSIKGINESSYIMSNQVTDLIPCGCISYPLLAETAQDFTSLFKQEKQIWTISVIIWASLVDQMIKNLSAMQDTLVQSLGVEDLLEKRLATYSVFFPGKSHEMRSLQGYRPGSGKVLAMTE